MKVVYKTVSERLDEIVHSKDRDMIKHIVITAEEYRELIGKPCVVHGVEYKEYAGIKLIVEEDIP